MNNGLTSLDIKNPGLRTLPPGVERYFVQGGGLSVIEISAQDKIEIINDEGKQTCEVIVFNSKGKCDLSILNLKENGDANFSKKTISQNEKISKLFNRKKLDINKAKSSILFDKDCLVGEKITLTSKDKCTVMIAAPGEAMNVHEQNPPTDLTIFLNKSEFEENEEQFILPEPLGDPVYEKLVKRRTAEIYEVKKGEYIQIIDTGGRQCSDFLTFDKAKLDKGIESIIDPTATRTFMGAAYPAPGLFSKFYDAYHDPLIEVVRDTVGRHDTFNYACTSKYYEDMGYFGHINCSDNFSKAFEKYEVKPRKGWIAINLFFNTSIDQLNVASFDEPWSRPGDYVLFRATKDLICASSACPCDVDAANGWNPTDIFVRTYPKEKKYSKAIAFRMKEDSEPKLTKETGFHKNTSKLTRNFTDYNGYWLANNYTNSGTIKEYTACREKAIAIDLSPLRKFEVVGPDSENLMQYALTRNVKKIAIGQVSYSAMCYENGGMIDDGTVFRLAKDNFRWIGGQEYSGTWLRELAKKKNYKAWVKSSTDQIHNISVQGPNSRKILEKFVWTPPTQPTIKELQWFRFTIARMDDHVGIPIIVSRTGYTGELGYEIWCHPKDASNVWEKVFEHGKDLGITPMGLEALDMVRIEAGLIFYGYEFNDQTDPFEAGIGFAVPLKTKEDNFVGKESLIKRKVSPQKKLVGLELIGKEQANNGDGVHVGRATVGVITSGMISPTLNKNIALCRMDVNFVDIGTNVEIGKLDGHQKRIGAKVIKFPFYDPDKTKVKS
jgi:aminomethyltransferase